MKPPRFEYVPAESLDHAVETLADLGEDAKFIAGGQSLVPLMAIRLSWPSHLVDIGGLPETSRITLAADGSLRVGATCVQRAAERSADVARACPLLPAAIACIGHVPIRNRGTVGGSLAHGDPASELPMSSVVLNAELVTRRPGGVQRVVAAQDFYLGSLTTVLEPDEVLEEVRIPAWPAGAGWGFHEFSRRNGDFAVVALAAMLRLAPGGTIAEARIAVAGVAATPLRAGAVESMLVGEWPDEEVFRSAGAELARSIEPHSDIHGSASFRRRLSAVLAERSLADAFDRAEVRQ